ncbi:MAG: hypothetical protein RLZZ428_1118 [Pseudomonadota bacterium]|jgi:hypothetical protein
MIAPYSKNSRRNTMKKTLLLSVAASAVVMAGGNISPVVAQASGWDFSGTAKAMYQTDDYGLSGNLWGADDDITGSVFGKDSSGANAGVQLRATNANVWNGVGAGIEVSALATLGLENYLVNSSLQVADYYNEGNTGGWLSQAYLTYNVGNTMIKAGRQELPKSLSPMAFSEDWNVFKNTFDAVVLVNSDIKDTTAVLAYVDRSNFNGLTGIYYTSMNDFYDINHNDKGAYMLTLQNKSIENVTLTGSYYMLRDQVNIAWLDAQVNMGNYNLAGQYATYDMDNGSGLNYATYGVKAATTVSGFDVSAAYTQSEDGMSWHQTSGTTSSSYTCTPLNQLVGGFDDENKYLVTASTAAMNGTLVGMYSKSDTGDFGTTTELDVVYSTKVADIDLSAAYVHAANDDEAIPGTDGEQETINLVRVTATYNF